MVNRRGLYDSHSQMTMSDTPIDIWQASLRQTDKVVAGLYDALSRDERERCERFYFEHLRRSFIVARGALRSILSQYLDCAPQNIEFEYATNGKPRLSSIHATAGVHFNLSHSGELVLYAIGRNAYLGIDVEQIRPVEDLMQLARRTFSNFEASQLESVPPDQRETAFFNCWTRKEAYIKALGDGLSSPLDQFDVSLKPGDRARILRIRGSEQQAAAWSMRAWQPASGYVAALAVEANHVDIELKTWAADASTPTLQEVA